MDERHKEYKVKKTLFKSSAEGVRFHVLHWEEEEGGDKYFAMVMVDSEGLWHELDIEDKDELREAIEVGPDEGEVRYWCGPHKDRDEIENALGLNDPPPVGGRQ